MCPYCAFFAQITDSADVKFLHQVVYGCQRYKRMLKVFLSSFYYNHSGEAALSDQTLYTVLAYLAILRLEELTFDGFKKLILALDFVKTRPFLKFLFSEESLTRWLKEGWLTLYEPHYVQTELIDQVLKFEPQVSRLVDELERRQAVGDAKRAAEAEAAIALAEGRGGAGKHTVPKPFNLTQPAPRLVPEPSQLVAVNGEAVREAVAASEASMPKARPWKRPEGPPKDQLELEKRMEQNRLELRKKYADPRAGRFELLAEKRPSNLEAVRAQVEAATAAALPFRADPPRPVPKWDADQGFVKLNAAAILREDQVYRRKQAEEARLLRAYEEDLADRKAYEQWSAAMRSKEEEDARIALEKRKAEMALADEMAKAATEQARFEKRALAARMRAEAEAVAAAQEQQREAEAEARRKQVSCPRPAPCRGLPVPPAACPPRRLLVRLWWRTTRLAWRAQGDSVGTLCRRWMALRCRAAGASAQSAHVQEEGCMPCLSPSAMRRHAAAATCSRCALSGRAPTRGRASRASRRPRPRCARSPRARAGGGGGGDAP